MSIRLKYILLCVLAMLTISGAAQSVHTWADESALNQGTWVKVALNLEQDGIYQITYSQLKSWGFNNPSQVGVYGYGGHMLPESFAENHLDDVPEVATLHDVAGQRILFYGRGITSWSYRNEKKGYVQRQHPYATYATYFLHQKPDNQQPFTPTLATSALTADVTLTTYDEHWLHETESVNLGKTGRRWFGESFTNTQSQIFNMPEEPFLQDHELIAGTIKMEVSFATKATASTSFSVRVNDKELGSQTVAATTGSYVIATDGTFNSDLAQVGSVKNPSVRITFEPGSNVPTQARLDYIRLQGQCQLEANANEPYRLFRNIQAKDQLAQYKIGNLNSQMQVWDVTHPTQIVQQQVSEDGCFTAQEKGLREYAIVNTAARNFPSVTRIGNIKNQNLHGLPAVNLVVVSAPGLFTQAKELAQYRANHDGLTPLIVTPEAIYNEYSSGVPDITAIRLFLKQMYDKSIEPDGTHTLRYLMLFGDGTYDNRAAYRSTFLLPSYETDASMSETGSSVCDDYFGFLDDSEGGIMNDEGQYLINRDLMDIGIGRIPVRTTQQAEQVVAKIKSYDTNQYGNWKNRLVFLSDDDMTGNRADSPNLHMRHNEDLINILQQEGRHEFIYQKIYLAAYYQSVTSSGTDYPDARKELNNALQQGSLVINYAGHGQTTGITHEQMMNSTLASQLRMKHLPVWITASCDVSRFDDDNASMGEQLFLNPNGGAAALISTSRIVYAAQNLSLNKAIVRNLFNRNSDGTRFRLGDILRSAKVALASDNNKLNFCLIGDPTMTLAFPEQEIKVDSIKGEFKSLNNVTIYGRVLMTGQQETDTTYNGLLYPTIYDAPDSITADKGVCQEPYLTFTSRKRKLFTGRSIIRNGLFQFSFMVPQDVKQSNDKGMVNFYACSERGDEANGYFDDFKIETNNEADKTDSQGPKILACFMDAPTFKSGDAVSETPFLYAEVYDENGINATGNSIGHDLCLNLKCLSNPLIMNRQIVLNDYFTTLTGTDKVGNVKYSLTGLDAGTYEATFRVWDVFNNASSYTFTFTVNYNTAPAITLLQAYPSPVRQGETITFRALHNRPDSADKLRIQVYTQTGIKVLDEVIMSNAAETVYLKPDATEVTHISKALNADETPQLMGSTTLQWTANVAPGVYLYRAYLQAGGSETSSQSKKLIVF